MSYVQTQTFDYRDNREELAIIGAALECLMHKDLKGASYILIARHDKLTAKAELKPYDPREARL